MGGKDCELSGLWLARLFSAAASLTPLQRSLGSQDKTSFGKIAMLKRSLTLLLILAFPCTILNADKLPPIHQPTLTPQSSGTTNGLIAVWPVNPQVVWACGRAGTFTVTTDGGQTWRAGVVPGAEALHSGVVRPSGAALLYLLFMETSLTLPIFAFTKTKA